MCDTQQSENKTGKKEQWDCSKESQWDFSQERQFIENLLCTRFNFFLVFYSIIIAGFVTTTKEIYRPIILILGAVITILLALSIYRCHIKLRLILEKHLDLKAVAPTHPAGIIDKECKDQQCWINKIFTVRWIIGWGIPLICCLSLIIGAILSLWKVI